MTDDLRLDREQVRMLPLAQRENKLNIETCAVRPGDSYPPLTKREEAQIEALAKRVLDARGNARPVVLTFGAHLVKNCLAPVVIRMMERGWVTHLATNGAGSIHDWEFAYQGATSENVRVNVARGMFGTWQETGKYINLAVATGGLAGLGYGASVGRMVAENGLTIPSRAELVESLTREAVNQTVDETLGAKADLLYLVSAYSLEPGLIDISHPFIAASIQCAAYRLGIPFTVHPGIGYDIIYTHPLNCGGAIGRGAVADFLSYAGSIRDLSGGVHVSIGSAIMAPMIFEKSMSMANSISIGESGKPIDDFYMSVVDIQNGGDWDWSRGEPPMDCPAYYLRFCKSFYRMGGELDYICLDNRAFMLALVARLEEIDGSTKTL